MKQIVKAILPKSVFNTLRRYYFKMRARRYLSYDINKWINHTLDDSLEKSIFHIITLYHMIEKGLTMPNRRLGFSYDVIRDLSAYLKKHILNYGDSHEQIAVAIRVLLEYRQLHIDNNFKLEDDINTLLEKLYEKYASYEPLSQIEMTKEEYFGSVNDSFEKFSKSRYSVRYFTGKEVDMDAIKKSISLAQSAPSACNRQSTRLKVVSDKTKVQLILDVQGGNRGFGHLVDKLIVVTTDMRAWRLEEMKAGYIDGGIYAMNLLYSLHHNKVAACALNSYFTPKSDRRMREIIDVPYYENFVMIIALGTIPERIMLTHSQRSKTDYTTTFY
ncbi:MAG: nitroreductase family protein [Bacteroidales bacterium]|nr:nitroreductase family protein [Bacteroidales bacterium]